ncbi:MAG: fibronectin type III domain-containing protein, partial [Actinobacteria bacterium]|nr:fibronectin type III domain-containing protein [Actinomycetota bacterium]
MVITTVTGSVAGSQTINVTWSAAAANGANVSSYVVKTRDLSVANSVPVTACTVDATQANPNLACTVSGLINGDSYEVQVFAANGLTTQATKQVTPYGAPSAPRNVAVSAGSASGVLTVTWQAPSSNGGTSLLQYTAEAFDQSG